MKVRYLIVEDEMLPAERLRGLVGELRPEYVCAAITGSIEDTVEFLRSNKADLIFMDVELADGTCFEIFKYVKVETPVIFTTAYTEYAIQAFKVNSMDYLLKPIRKTELGLAIDKFETISRSLPVPDYLHVAREISSEHAKQRILVSRGDAYFYLEMPDIAFFHSEDKYTFVHTFGGQRHLINYTLNRLEAELDRSAFFRLSRNYIVNIRAVRDIRKFFDGRLKVTLSLPESAEILVSAARREDFLRWIGDERS